MPHQNLFVNGGHFAEGASALESSKGLLKSIYQWGTQKETAAGGTVPYGKGTEPLQNSR